MGTAQSIEEGSKKCPLPGRPFVSTPNNVVNATEKACNRAKRIKTKLLMEPSEVVDTIPTIKNMKEMNEGEIHPTEPPVEMTELKEWRGERPSEEGVEMQPITQRVQQGGMKAAKKLHIKELRELLKENRIKVTNKGKYLTKKQMLNKLKMIKWN
jgi:hypothetical protein